MFCNFLKIIINLEIKLNIIILIKIYNKNKYM